ncbi:MAG TPA: hypothetical protein PK014_09790 [Thermoanaerobaculia bacterium]|nr:hypothetical protein [Thermoanaerobaculia bacterium]HUM30115.1 hypothetical protein [Thermoanaerobaculia bacterium]HXK68812.1 hypothetical protein [Thermoanaerobaculia bacterium]
MNQPIFIIAFSALMLPATLLSIRFVIQIAAMVNFFLHLRHLQEP